MATAMKLESAEPVASVTKSEPISELVEHDVVPAKGVTSDSTLPVSKSRDAKCNHKSEGNGTFGFNGVTDQAPAGDQSIHNSTTSSYNYYYPGYSGSFGQVDGSHMGVRSDNGSLVYYLPGGQQPFFTSGYVQHPVSYGSEAMPCYSWDSPYVGDVSNGYMGSRNGKYGSGSSFAKSNGFNSVKSNSNNGLKSTQSTKPLNKVSTFGSDLSGSVTKRYNHVGKFSSYPVGKQGSFSQNCPMNYRQNGRIWNWNDRDRSRDRFYKNNDHETSPELTCGPRGSCKSASLESTVKEDLGIMINVYQYNLPEFESVY